LGGQSKWAGGGGESENSVLEEGEAADLVWSGGDKKGVWASEGDESGGSTGGEGNLNKIKSQSVECSAGALNS